MHYTLGLDKVVSVNIKYATLLYGVNVEIYAPVDDFDGALQAYGDLKYSREPVYDGKLLIPEYLYRNSANSYASGDFTEDTYSAYSRNLYPKFSKVVVTEVKDLLSFIIVDTQDFRDSSQKELYYTYKLIPSSQLLNRDGSIQNLSEVQEYKEDTLLDDPDYLSITDLNQISDSSLDNKFNYHKL